MTYSADCRGDEMDNRRIIPIPPIRLRSGDTRKKRISEGDISILEKIRSELIAKGAVQDRMNEERKS